MNQAFSLDRQLADMVWVMTTALRAGYSIEQLFEQLASEAPEPAAKSCARVFADLQSGLGLNQALINWQKSVDSMYLPEVIKVFQKQQQTGGHLPDLLEPVGNEILEKAGTDQAFWPMMRMLAQNVGAKLPQRIQGN